MFHPVTRDDDDYRKEFTDAYVSAHHRLSKQNIGFVGANRHRGTDLGLSGIPLDFDAGTPACTKSEDDPVGCHITPAIGGDAVPLSVFPDEGTSAPSTSAGGTSPAMALPTSSIAASEGVPDEETRADGDASKNEP